MLNRALVPSMVRDMADRLGWPATMELVKKLGGTTVTIPMRATSAGQVRYSRLVSFLGRELASALCSAYPATDLYIPNCKRAVTDERDAALNRDRDELAKQNVSEREIVATLALRYKLSDRHVWRILKKPVCPVSSEKKCGRQGTLL